MAQSVLPFNIVEVLNDFQRSPRRHTFFQALACAALIPGALGCSTTGYAIGTANARPIVQSDAERDLDCPADRIRLEEGWGGSWEAVGCGQKKSYKANCNSIQCVVHGEGEPPVVFQDRPEFVPR